MKGLAVPIIVSLLALAVIGSVAVLYLFPYNPTSPPKVNDTGWTKEGLNKVVEANNEFAIKLYSKITDKNSNVFFSPYSIISAFGMVYEGSNGETEQEFKSAMGFPDTNELNPNFARLYNILNNKSQDYTLRTGNALWVQKNFKLKPDYVNNVEEYFGGKAANLDFVNDPVGSVKTINDFISKQTNGKITDLVSTNDITPYTKLVLTNAIYFKGTWRYKFPKSKTRDRDFHLVNGDTIKTPMMCMEPDKELNYANLETLKILELPYKGDLSMIVILPKNGEEYAEVNDKYELVKFNYTIEDIEKNLTITNLEKWESQMKPTKLNKVCMPKFKMETKYYLIDPLKSLGLRRVFDPMLSDLSRMSDVPLYVQKAIHKAYVSVDEEGTEAAAATAIVVGIKAAPPWYEQEFIADHPFIFLIKDNRTGAILFMGRVMNPTQQTH